MATQPTHTLSPFTAAERELIRREMSPRFGQYPQLANGLFLRTWRAGPQKGQPRIPLAVQGMVDRGLLTVGTGVWGFAAFFTAAGIEALRQLLGDCRAMDPLRFAHLRAELGIGMADDPRPATAER